MEKKKKEYASTIVPVSPLKAFLGFAVDFFLAFGLMMVGILFLAPQIQNAMGYQNKIDGLVDFSSSSSLFSVTRKSDTITVTPYLYGSDFPKTIGVDGKIKESYDGLDAPYVGHYPFELYEEIMYRYYMDFCYANETADFLSIDGKSMPEIKGYSKAEAGRYVGENVFKIDGSEESYYRFALDANGQPDYSAKPVLNEANATVADLSVDGKQLVAASTLNKFFVDSKTGVYTDSYAYFTNHAAYRRLYDEASNMIFIAKIPTRLVPPLIFLLILPMILRDGKSLGRLFSRTAVIDYRGYSAKKWRILLHQVVLFLPWLLALLPFDILALFSVAILYFLEFFVFLASPTKRTIHERIAGTLTVNDEESSYFGSREELEQYLATPEGQAFLAGERPTEEEPEVIEEEPVISDENPAETPQNNEIIEEEPISSPATEEVETEVIDEDEDAFLDERKK